ncbi:MAG: hypothetical protein GX224_00740 [Thermoplasmatales archaeon]|nr:hypothetical protein [Thermoplasmatales archaeon]
MDFLGNVTLAPGDGTVLAIGSVAPEIGDAVYDSKKKKIGSVRRVFGPVDSPYVSVKLSGKTSPGDGKLYYAKEGKHGIKRKTRD